MIELFAGWDAREEVGFHVFCRSVLARASVPVRITPVGAFGGPQGTNEFTYSRFMVPKMMGYHGHVIFMDGSDMLVQDDIAKLDRLFDPEFAVQVVKHPTYKTRHKVKYIGTSMECPNTNYARKNWASAMLINCEHEAWRSVPEGLDALQLRFIPEELIGDLPDVWNRLVDEGHEPGSVCHWTAGVPAFKHYATAPHADLWHAERTAMMQAAA